MKPPEERYKPINGWTRESIVDHIYLNFKGKSVSADGITCLYRGSEGLKCRNFR